jgi:hypothetical protein
MFNKFVSKCPNVAFKLNLLEICWFSFFKKSRILNKQMSLKLLLSLNSSFKDERLNDPGHSILVRKSYNFARYLNLTFTDLENIANLLFKN